MTGTRKGRLAAAFDWAFRDRRSGAVTIAQWPNIPLWLFLALTVAAWAAKTLDLPTLWPRAGAALALAWWALDEIVRGANPWRRFLGAAVLVGYAAAHLRQTGG